MPVLWSLSKVQWLQPLVKPGVFIRGFTINNLWCAKGCENDLIRTIVHVQKVQDFSGALMLYHPRNPFLSFTTFFFSVLQPQEVCQLLQHESPLWHIWQNYCHVYAPGICYVPRLQRNSRHRGVSKIYSLVYLLARPMNCLSYNLITSIRSTRS